MRNLVVVVLGAAALAVAGCGKSSCGPSNCPGCCDASGVCQGAADASCGLGGAACVACVGGQHCTAGVCAFGGGGNAAGGNSGGTTTSSTSSTSSSSSGSSGTTASSGSTGSGGTTTSSTSSTTSSSTTASSTSTTSSSTTTSSSGSTGTTTSSTTSSSTTSSSSTTGSSGSTGSTTGLCTQGAARCDPSDDPGTARQLCDATGHWTADTACGSGTYCAEPSPGQTSCTDACTAAASRKSMYGCDTWGAITANSLATSFEGGLFDGGATGVGTNPSDVAFAFSNPLSASAHVTVDFNGLPSQSLTVPGNGSAFVQVPWKSICGTGVANDAYHITSDAPVAAYLFNPLDAVVSDPGTTCSQNADCDSYLGAADGVCQNSHCLAYSYTADATLLPPVSALGTRYVVVTGEEQEVNSAPLPGQFAVISTANNTQLSITFAGPTVASSAPPDAACTTQSGTVAAYQAGQTASFTLNQGDVLQFASAPSGTSNCVSDANMNQNCQYPSDLSGTIIVSRSSPVLVLSGAECGFVPFDQWACDHLEEALLPTSAWGTTFVGTKSGAYAGATSSYPDYWRLLSSCDATTCPNGVDVSIDPAISGFRPLAGSSASCATAGSVTTCHLPAQRAGAQQGLELQEASSFVAQANQPVQLAQLLVGQAAAAGATEGDPSLAITAPVQQWRSSYHFFVPASYSHRFVSLAVDGQAATSQVLLDGAGVSAASWAAVPGSSYYAATVTLPSGTDHTVTASGGVTVGVSVYAYEKYTSIAYSAGQQMGALQ